MARRIYNLSNEAQRTAYLRWASDDLRFAMRQLGVDTIEDYIALACRICQVRHRVDNPNHLAPTCRRCRHCHWFAAGASYAAAKRERCRFTPSRRNYLAEIVFCEHWELPVPAEEAEKQRLWAQSEAEW